jgi:penicillin-binding protein 2
MDKSTSRLKILAILVAFMFAALSTRLWFLQVLSSASAGHVIEQQSTRIVKVDALRGDIFDDQGRKIVDNRISLEVRVNKQDLGDDAEAVLLRLSDVLSIPVSDIRQALDDKDYFDYQPKPVAIDVDKDVAFYLKEHRRDFPGVEVVEASVRNYPEGSMAAHILGYVGQINAQEIEDPSFKAYGPNDLVGRSGLEQVYEHYLHGRKGLEKLLINSNQEVIRSLGSEEPVPGNNLVLSIDIDAQRIAERALVQGIERTRTIFDDSQDPPGYLKANAGTVIVMDPSTGAVKALASWPTFDPAWFVGGLTRGQIAYLFDNPQAPTLNRATQLTYAPGSTFKPFVALSAVQSGVANLGSYYPCPPEYEYPGDTSGTIFHNWTTANLGTISIARALQVSCDTVFYGFGGDFYGRYTSDQLGVDPIPMQKDLRQFGFGRVTGIDLPTEAEGLIPTPRWKEGFSADNPELFNPGEEVWLPGDNIQMAIGQGYVTVTPLQLATAYAAIANGGKICTPHLVDRIEYPDGSLARRVTGHCGRHTLPYTQAELDYINAALATVTQSGGTAGLAFSGFPLSDIPVAGKTGTAQRPPFQDTSWFAAMVPAGDPQYVVIAMIEQAGHGSTSAAPIVRQIIEGLFGLVETGAVDGGSND